MQDIGLVNTSGFKSSNFYIMLHPKTFCYTSMKAVQEKKIRVSKPAFVSLS